MKKLQVFSDRTQMMNASDVLEARLSAVLADVGIKRVVNGPITYTIDGAPLVGPIPGKRNAFCIIGLRAGLGEGGGHGSLLAQQIVHGEACYDTCCLDPRRFTGHANVELTSLKAIEDYQNDFLFPTNIVLQLNHLADPNSASAAVQ